MALDGAPPIMGRRAYGYDKHVTLALPDEAARIREAAQRVLDGESVRRIALDWNKRQVPTVAGDRGFSPESIIEIPQVTGRVGCR